VNRLPQQASGYVVSQGVFWVVLICLVEHKDALRSKGNLILEDSDRLQDKEKLILGNAKWLLGNTNRLSGIIEPESGRTESEPGKTEPSLGKEKPVLGNTNQLPGNEDRLSGKADLETKPSSDKAESGPSYGCGLRKELESISGEEDNEESVTKKSESGNVGSPIDEEKMELVKEYDSVKCGDMIWTDWRLPLLKCIRDPGKTTNKKVK
jgi:hypothetical protein